MIVEVLIATTGVVVLGAYWLADRVMKRETSVPTEEAAARKDVDEALASWRQRASNTYLSSDERETAAKRVKELEDKLMR